MTSTWISMYVYCIHRKVCHILPFHISSTFHLVFFLSSTPVCLSPICSPCHSCSPPIFLGSYFLWLSFVCLFSWTLHLLSLLHLHLPFSSWCLSPLILLVFSSGFPSSSVPLDSLIAPLSFSFSYCLWQISFFLGVLFLPWALGLGEICLVALDFKIKTRSLGIGQEI